jgi:hypothetical protein
MAGFVLKRLRETNRSPIAKQADPALARDSRADS